jgi:hypothetical protein
MNSAVNRDEAIAKIMQVTGSDEVTANFIYDIETGAQTGDSLNQDGVDPLVGVSTVIDGGTLPT